MGASESASRLGPEQISQELRTLGSPGLSPQKALAFEKLRRHFCPALSAEQKLAAVGAINAQRYEIWTAPPPNASVLPSTELADRIRGLVYGAALGDATGLATEFLSRAQVTEFYGADFAYSPQPSKTYPDTHRMMWSAGDWTDDTDQLVLILQSLLHCGGRADVRDFARRLLDWRQHGFAALGDESAAGLGQHTKSVVSDPEFLQDPLSAAQRTWRKGGCSNAANGAVMRTAISGVPFFWAKETVVANTAAFCHATHADPRCLASCVVVAILVSELLRGRSVANAADLEALVSEAVAEAASCVVPSPQPASSYAGAMDSAAAAAFEAASARELQRATRALSLNELELDEPRTIGYTYKCLGSGLWALRSGLPFDDAIRQLVGEGGDADTNAAVAGALLGSKLGFSALPSGWIAQLPHCAWLEAHVQKLLFMLKLR